MAQVFRHKVVQWFVPSLCWSSFCLVPASIAQVVTMDKAGGVSGGTVYVFRWNSRNELSVPPVEDLQKVWNWLNPAEVKAGETSASEQNLDRSIRDFLQARNQALGQYLAVPVK